MTATLIAGSVFSLGMSLLIGLPRRIERQRRYEALRVMLEAVMGGVADPDTADFQKKAA